MSQFFVYQNKNPASKKLYPYLMDVQSSLLNVLETRLVIPLVLKENFQNQILSHLNPSVIIDNREYIAVTQQLAAIFRGGLGNEVAVDILDRNEILASIDFLITGI